MSRSEIGAWKEKWNLMRKGFNMSVFFCNSCDQLIDSDEMTEFEYYKSTDTWKCQGCIENDNEEILNEED